MALPPAIVQQNHRRKAWALYSVLVLAFVGYSLYVVIEAIEERENPPTRFTVRRQLYKFPTITVCPGDGIVPNIAEDSIDCFFFSEAAAEASGSADTESSCDFAIGNFTGEAQPCVTFNQNRTITLTSKDDAIDMDFGFNPVIQNTTNNPVELQWIVFVYESLDELATIDVFYVPFGASSVQVSRSVRTFLDSPMEVSYSASVQRVDLIGFASELGTSNFVRMTVSIPNTQVDFLSEIDPLSVQTILGVIAGFWNYVGLIFGLFFIVKAGKGYWRFDPAVKKEKDKQSAKIGSVLSALSGGDEASGDGGDDNDGDDDDEEDEDDEKEAGDKKKKQNKKKKAAAASKQTQPKQTNGMTRVDVAPAVPKDMV